MSHNEDEAIMIAETLELLQTVFPELITNSDESMPYKLTVNFHPETCTTFSLIKEGSDNKTVASFKTQEVVGYDFVFRLPLTKDNFRISSIILTSDQITRLMDQVRHVIEDTAEMEDETASAMSACNFAVLEAPIEHEKELLRNYHFFTTNETLYHSWYKACMDVKFAKFHKSRFCCSICLEYKDGSDGVLFDCEHCICKDCFKEFATVTIDDGDVTKLQCPDCPMKELKGLNLMGPRELRDLLFTRKISNEMLQMVLSKEYMKKYEELFSTLTHTKFATYYPNLVSKCTRCKEYVIRDDADELLIICGNCNFAHCFECGHSWHGRFNGCGEPFNAIPQRVVEHLLSEMITFEEIALYEARYGRKFIKRAVNMELAERAFRAEVESNPTLVECPKKTCRQIITKGDGCNKMRCAVCGTHFCFLCGTALLPQDPYAHYRERSSDCFERLFEGMRGVVDEEPEFQLIGEIRL